MKTSKATVAVHTCLISVSDTRGVLELAAFLQQHGVRIITSSGTGNCLRKGGVASEDVSEVTHFPEMMGGRLKTLHPVIHGGLLARRDTEAGLMAEYDMLPVDLLVVNFYPFSTVANSAGKYSDQEVVENIDIGGPAMLRAAAKNHLYVTVASDDGDYAAVRAEIEQYGGTSLALRRRMAHKAFAVTASYDAAIDRYFAQKHGKLPLSCGHYSFESELSYGENPHQRAALFTTAESFSGGGEVRSLHGGELSYNNHLDLSCALRLLSAFGEQQPACVVIKHGSPCGVGCAKDLLSAYNKAYDSDSLSAFGGVVAFNQRVDKETVQAMRGRFTALLAAPQFDGDALVVLRQRQKTKVVAASPFDAEGGGMDVRSVYAGLLMQSSDIGSPAVDDWKCCTRRWPKKAEMDDLLFAWHVVKQCYSNAIVCAFDGQSLGLGVGQTSRIDAVLLSLGKASRLHKSALPRAVLASDGFFPFSDCIDAAHEYGIRVIIQPGGSTRDAEVISRADQCNIAMILTRTRCFRH